MPATVLTPGEVKCSSQDGRLNCWYDLALALPLTRILRLSSVPVGVPISGFKHQSISRIAIWALTVHFQGGSFLKQRTAPTAIDGAMSPECIVAD